MKPWPLLLLTACSAPFTMAPYPADDAAPDAVYAVADDARDANAPETTTEASAPEADPPESGARDAFACFAQATPYCPPICGACQPMAVPGMFFEVHSGGCSIFSTPTACRTCGAYTCACLLAHVVTCADGTSPATCDDSSGALTLLCP